MINILDTLFSNYYIDQKYGNQLEQQIQIENLMILTGLASGQQELDKIFEMASKATIDGQEYWDIPKIPIFMNKEDIYYIRQFPPSFWKQALSYRYNHLIINTHKAKEAKQEVSDWQWIELRYRKNKIKFYIDTGANALYERLTLPIDPDALRKMNHQDREQYESQNKRYHGFQFDNPQLITDKKTGGSKTHPVWITEDYVGVAESTFEKRLQQWLSLIKDGWLGMVGKGPVLDFVDKPKKQNGQEEGQEEAQATLQKKKKIVHSTDWVNKFVSIWNNYLQSALYKYLAVQEKQLEYGEIKQRIIEEQDIPKLLLETDGEGYIIWKGVSSKGSIYSSNPQKLPVLMPGKNISTKVKAKHDQYLEAAEQARKAQTDQQVIDLIKKLKNVVVPSHIEKKLEELKDEAGNIDPQLLIRQLDYLSKIQSAMLIKAWLKTQGLNVDAINIEQLNDEKSLQDIKKKLAEFVVYSKDRAANIKKTAKRYTEWDYALGEHNKKYPALYGTLGIGNVNPNNQQKGRIIGEKKDWSEILTNYFGRAAMVNGQPYVLTFNVTDVDLKRQLPRTTKYWSEKSAIEDGISAALNSKTMMSQAPERMILNNARRELFNVINRWMIFQTDKGPFKNFLEAYAEKDVDKMKESGQVLYQEVKKMASNFVYSIFQLSHGRGTIRKRKSGENSVALGNILADQEKDLEQIATHGLEIHPQRRLRTVSKGTTLRYGHSIEVIRANQEAAAAAAMASDPAFGNEYGKLAAKISGDMTLFLLHKNLYIYDKTKKGEKYTNQEAEQHAMNAMAKGLSVEGEKGTEQTQSITPLNNLSDANFLQFYTDALVGTDFQTTKTVPEATIRSLAGDPTLSVYKELQSYVQTKKIKDIDLTQYPQFIIILQQVILAVNNYLAAQQRKLG